MRCSTSGSTAAVTLIAEKIAKGPSGRRFGADPGKPLGDHPTLAASRSKRPLRRLCHGWRRERDDPERQDAGDHHAAGSHRADRRARGKRRRQAEARREKSRKAAKPAKAEPAAEAPKPAKKASRQKVCGETKIRCRQQGARTGKSDSQNLAAKTAKPVAKKTAGKASG